MQVILSVADDRFNHVVLYKETFSCIGLPLQSGITGAWQFSGERHQRLPCRTRAGYSLTNWKKDRGNAMPNAVIQKFRSLRRQTQDPRSLGVCMWPMQPQPRVRKEHRFLFSVQGTLLFQLLQAPSDEGMVTESRYSHLRQCQFTTTEKHSVTAVFQTLTAPPPVGPASAAQWGVRIEIQVSECLGYQPRSRNGWPWKWKVLSGTSANLLLEV